MSITQLELILRNRRPHEHQVGVRYDVLERAVQEFVALTDRVCTCTQVAQFDPPTVNTPLDAGLQLRNQKKMRAEDAGKGWDAVDAAVRVRREASEEFARRAGA